MVPPPPPLLLADRRVAELGAAEEEEEEEEESDVFNDLEAPSADTTKGNGRGHDREEGEKRVKST